MKRKKMDLIRLLQKLSLLPHKVEKFVDDWMKRNAPAIVETNIHQLYEQGVDSEGKPTGEYSESTIKRKKAKGQKYDHITLKDTGTFYRTIRLNPEGKNRFEITTDYDVWKKGLQKRWPKALGLTEENMKGLVEQLTDDLRIWLTDYLR